MRCIILSPGKFSKGSPEETLFNLYAKRLPGTLELKEIDTRTSLPAGLQAEMEGKAFLGILPPNAYSIALDEGGKTLTSPEFATLLDTLSQTISQPLYFIIGGAHGLGPTIKKRANLLLSLGSMTWPHLLVRALLAEQLYRAHTILSGHPYHK